MLSFIYPGLVLTAVVIIFSFALYYIIRDLVKPVAMKWFIKLVMNNMGVLDTESVEKTSKYILINYVYLGTKFVAIVPLSKELPPRSRKLFMINDNDDKINITGIRGSTYNFTPNDLGVNRIIMTDFKGGQEKISGTFIGNDEVHIC